MNATASTRLLSGRFRILSALGQGGMGRVVLAEDTWRDRRRVALKLAGHAGASDAPGRAGEGHAQALVRRALEHEFRLLASLRHPHLVSAREFGTCRESQEAWFSMDHAAGPTLAEACAGQAPAVVADLLAQLARGLAFLHSRGWVHGDVKTENVVVVPGGDGGSAGTVRLLDFGLARRVGASAAPGFSGTMSHAAPEVLQGEPADPRSDLYALGVVAHQLFTGRLPFAERDPLQLREAHLHRAPPALTAEGLPRAAAEIVDRLLAKNPDSRPRDAAAVADGLARAFPGLADESLESLLAWAVSPRLVGREEAESACLGLWARARDPREEGPRVLWLIGGEGHGKSHLLSDLAMRAQAGGALVLRGSPGSEPLSLLAEPLRDALRLLEPVVAQQVPGLSALSAVLPELASSRREDMGLEERLVAVAAATWDVMRAVATQSVVLLLDGLEHCQAEDRRVLELLARMVELDRARGRGTPFALAGALSDGAGADEPWSAALKVGRQVRLEPLGQDALRAVVEGMFPGLSEAGPLAEIIAREGGGNAGLAEDWCAELVRQGLLARGARGFSLDLQRPEIRVPPPGAAERIVREVDALDEGSRALLAAAALAPAPMDPTALGRAAELAPDAMESALDLLERRHLVRVQASPSGRRARAASPRIADAVRARQPGLAGMAQRLLEDPAGRALPPGERSLLAEAAGLIDVARDLLVRALADAEAQRDSPRAASHALRLAAMSTGLARRDAWRRAALALMSAERQSDAEGAAARARADGLDGAAEESVQLSVEGRLERRRGRLEQATSLLKSSLRIAAEARQPPDFETQVELARLLVQARSPEGDALTQGLLGTQELPAQARLSLRVLESSRLLRAHENARARGVLEAARKDARDLGLGLTEAACENNLGVLALREGDLAAARRHLDRAVRLRLELGVRGAAASTLNNLSLVEVQRGRAREAVKHARAAAEILEEIGHRSALLIARLNEMVGLLLQEDLAGMLALEPRVAALNDEVSDPSLAASRWLIAADLGHQLGDAALARRALAQGRCPEADPRVLLGLRVVEAALDGGPDLAAEIAQEILASQDAIEMPVLSDFVVTLARVPECWLVPGGPQAAAIPAVATQLLGHARRLSEAKGVPSPRDRASLLLAHAAVSAREGAPVADVARLIRQAGEVARSMAPSQALALLAARAWLAEQEGDLARAEARLEEAIALLRRRSALLPEDRRAAFLARPDRAAFRQALLALRRKRVERSADAGWEALVAPGASARAGRAKPRRDAAAERELAASRLREQRLREILEISRGISALQPTDELLGQSLASAMRFMNADRGFIVLGRPGEPLRYAVARDREGRDIPRAEFAISHSMLAQVVTRREPLLASDAQADERFVSKASVLAQQLRSVLVVPLVANAEVIGAIYVDNRQESGVFGQEHLELLRLLADQAAVAVENARLHEARIEKERTDQELEVARGIQQSLLPRSLPEQEQFRLAAVMQPARNLGGDWYDVVPGPGGSFTLTVGDVSGKGVGAALFMVMARTILRAELDGAGALDDMLVAANAEIAAQLDDDKFLTLVALRAGGEGRTVRYALAGHEPPVVYRRADASALAVPEGGLALGMLPSLKGRIEERRLDLEPGDLVCCVSDGVTECRAVTGDLYGRERLLALIARKGAAGAKALLESLLAEVDAWRGMGERSDDVTIVVLEARG